MTTETCNLADAPMTTEEQKGMIRSFIMDAIEDDDAEKLFAYLDHANFDVDVLSDAAELPAAWVAHYRLGQGSYDVDRALMDLLTWPPVARAIFEGQQAQQAAKDRQQGEVMPHDL